MDDQIKAMALLSFVLSNTTVTRLYQSGKITSEEAAEIYDQALLNLEQQQAIAGREADAVQIARALLEGAVREVRKAPDFPSE